MRRFALAVIGVTLLSGSVVQAASYQLTSGAIVDPILNTSGSTHSYSGIDLEPYADLTDAYLDYANLYDANLSYATLTDAMLIGADLDYANIMGANLYDANLTNATLTTANLTGANLHDANLTNADLSYAYLNYATFSTGTTLYDGQTVLQHGFDAAGLEAYLEGSPVSAWSTSNLTIVPEPASVCLLLFGLLLLTRVRV